MGMNGMVRRVVFLLASFYVACGSGTPTSPTPSTARSFNGTWTGGSDTPIRCVIQDGVLTSFSITATLGVPGTSSCTNTHTVTPGVSIANSMFSFSADLFTSTVPVGFELFTGPVAGTFATERSGSVTLGRTGSTPARAGDGLYAFVYGVQCGLAVITALRMSPVTIPVTRS